MKEIVYVPRDLEESIPDFLKNRKMEVLLLSDSVYAGDFETVEKIAHTLKGVAYRYGFNGISKLGELIEKSAKKRDFPKIIKAVEELDDELDEIEIVYI
jgi:HPt (histidine-containing phosphotransfer) domain-containing protein